MPLPQYTRKDMLILATTLPPVVVLFNVLLFGKNFFSNTTLILCSGLLVAAVMALAWIGYALIAVTVRNRLPQGRQLLKRMLLTIFLISLVQAFVTTLIFKGYDYFGLFGYSFEETPYYWMLAIGIVLNVMVTLVHEGVDSFERWKNTLQETEQLKRTYTQSQLLGLKSQINPHFLFNSLNSLSSLISEDEEKAEAFLNELTKVYRYMLSCHEEQFVPLETEIQFLHSYFYLLQTRYGNSLELNIKVPENDRKKFVTPLLLQAVFEYGFNTGMLSRKHPMLFAVNTDADGNLILKNEWLPRKHPVEANKEGIFNIADKYKLLCKKDVEVQNDNGIFTMKLPLIEHKIVAL